MELISVQVCVDPTEIGWLCAGGLRDCQRCGFNHDIAALLKFPELSPDSTTMLSSMRRLLRRTGEDRAGDRGLGAAALDACAPAPAVI